jgi:hypothetical protein
MFLKHLSFHEMLSSWDHIKLYAQVQNLYLCQKHYSKEIMYDGVYHTHIHQTF